MTKINKLGKSTFVIAILSFILVAVLAFGGTYAYFSAATDAATGKVVTGHLHLATTAGTYNAENQINSYVVSNTNVVQPGQLLVGEKDESGNFLDNGKGAPLTVTATSNINYYLRVKFDVEVITGTINDSGEWEAATKTHDGVIAKDNPLTDTNEGEDDSEATIDQGVEGADKINIDNQVDKEGDNVSDDMSILTISLLVGKNDAQTKTAWTEYMHKEDPADENEVAAHTGYFYPAWGSALHTAPTGESDDGKDTFDMEVLVNIADWVGAYGCTYYMDAVITISFQVEVLQAEYLDEAAINNAEVDFDEDGTAGISSIRELHKAWDYAVALAQPVQNP